MSSRIENSGIPEYELIEKTFPSEERRKAGPYAVIECWQRIPCDPCVASCPFGCIAPMEDINDLPELDQEACNGCGNCIAQCPGLAIFVLDETWGDENQALIRIPHEFAPLPEVGQIVSALNREGNHAADAQVISVRKAKSGTPVIHIAVPRNLIREIRAIKPL
ncbi:MAG TPA: 4Fe-4S ferredoxin [candidate division Zixibacteria bacterium]|nr:4Fe-4S ferredoxin [candidate division Zixibacteria bacterium]